MGFIDIIFKSTAWHTGKDYPSDLLCFSQVVGDRPLHDITCQDVANFIMLQGQKGFAPTALSVSILETFTESYNVPQALLRVKTIQTSDSLPKYLHDYEGMSVKVVQ